jgi:hypothetical protein
MELSCCAAVSKWCWHALLAPLLPALLLLLLLLPAPHPLLLLLQVAIITALYHTLCQHHSHL